MGRKIATQIGDVHGRLTVVYVDTRPDKQGKFSAWATCRCECGTMCEVPCGNLRYGGVKSCGCWRQDSMRQIAEKYGPGAKSHDRRYSTWKNMINRCEKPTTKGYQHYGGRGISVCAEWHDYPTFYAWTEASGYEPHLSIDRIDNDGNYEPDNCRWVTQSEQRLNARKPAVGTTGPRYEAWGESKTWREWELDERVKVKRQTFHARRRGGWENEQALSVPAVPLREYLRSSGGD